MKTVNPVMSLTFILIIDLDLFGRVLLATNYSLCRSKANHLPLACRFVSFFSSNTLDLYLSISHKVQI